MTAQTTHGGISDAELARLGLRRDDVIDLSANLHPAGPDPRVLAAARSADVAHYPEPDAATLRAQIAGVLGVETAQVVVTAGASAAIDLAVRALTRRRDRWLVFPPAFGEYERAIRAAGGALVGQRREAPDFVYPPAPRADFLFVCQPDNPTGVALSRDDLARLVAESGALPLVDAAYIGLLDAGPQEAGWDPVDLVREGEPALVIGSLTKLHAIPGLRVGYALAPAQVVARMATLQPPWAVGGPALAAASVALTLDDERRASARTFTRNRESMRTLFARHGVRCAPGRASFLLAEVGDAVGFRERLLARGVVVRDAASFGLRAWVRIATPPDAALALVMEALSAALGEESGD